MTIRVSMTANRRVPIISTLWKTFAKLTQLTSFKSGNGDILRV
ncbi:hypothetical protein [Halobacillus faecis]